jgi:phage gp16-like protein
MERAAKQARKRSTDERSRLLSRVHIAKKALGLDEDTYREMLGSLGVKSAGDLALPPLRQVTAALERDVRRMQARGAAAPAPDRNPYADTPRNLDVPDRSAQLGKISALLTEMSLAWGYADGIALQMFQVAKAEWLAESGQRAAIIAALVKESRRRHAWFQGQRDALIAQCRDVLGRGQTTVEVIQRGRDFAFHRICPGGPRGEYTGPAQERGFILVWYAAGELLKWCETYAYIDPASAG